MVWRSRYWVRHYLENSICVFPILSIGVAMVLVRIVHQVDSAFTLNADLHPDAARGVLATLSSAMFTCVVFISSALLLVVQLASAQLTPRIIGTMFQDRATKLALTIFVFTFTFSLSATIRVGETVPRYTVGIATYSCVVSVAALLYLIDHVGRKLRPGGALRGVVKSGRQVILSLYKRRYGESDERLDDADELPHGEAQFTFASPTDGVLLAFDIGGLVALAESADCVIRMVPQVGTFVATGDIVFCVFGAKAPLPAAVLRESIAYGPERTLDQDPLLAFRIIVDIACKALSAAINDPTTAVIAIDQIHHLLRLVAGRNLDHGWVCDARGVLRLVYPRPTWDDYVNLASTEIRQFGGHSIQVVRRLKAMLTDLIDNVPPNRRPPLQRQLELLRKTAERSFEEAADRKLAEVGDVQGVGGVGNTAEDNGSTPSHAATAAARPN